ncbi:hypothetical protein GALMADRAFT_64911 [Galerina marginata CBS 339.88]|uniref:Calcium-channel protein CCH1 n=1 Tax=Galerina marginata (strain CBS 339.88) TaxID=685588 RepID=A0A067T4M9_GALM3|nr:hypothetical protein GALMADRAFT_64911 [Galerina marginata CBS 339.88]
MIAWSVVDLANYGVGNKVSLVAENDDDRASMPDHVRTLALRGRTLGFLGPRSKIRLASYNVLVHPLTEPLILLLIILNAAILTIQAFSNLTPNGQDTPSFRPGYLHSWENIILLMIFTLFTLEAFARICVTGFLFYPEVPTLALFSRHGPTPSVVQPTTLFSAGHSITHQDVIALPFNPRISDSYNKPRRPVPYLQHSWSKLDFIAIVSFWIMFTLGITGAEKDKSYIGVFMAMSVLRTARLLMITHGSATIMHSLRIARPLLASVAYLVAFVMVLFSIIGVQFFGGSLRKTCAVSPSPGEIPYLQTSQVCAGYINHTTLNATSLKGYICPLGQLCMVRHSSSEGQFGGFNTIYSSFLQVAILATGEGWTSLMYSIIDSELFVSSFFFILAVIILKLWLFNLFIAVTTHTFAAIRSETRRTAFGGVSSVATPNLQDDGWTSSDNRMTRPNTTRTIYAKTEWCWITLAFVSLMLQATRTVNILPTHELMLRYSEVAIAIAFNFEIGLRLIATLPDWRSFFKHRNNWIDLILAVGSTMIDIPFIRHSPGYPWFSVFQLARFYRVILVVPFTEPLLMACFGNMHGLANVTLFFAIVNYIAALGASQFLQTELPFSNRLTSGETLNSFLGNYQVLSRNSWTGIFYDTAIGKIPPGQGVLALSFISARMLFANVIMLPMLVALINENFEVEEEQKKNKQASSYLQNEPHRGEASGLNPFHWVSQLPWNLVFSVRKKRGLQKPWFMKPQQLSSKLTSIGTVLAADIETNVIPLLTLHHNQRNARVDRLVDEMDDPLRTAGLTLTFDRELLNTDLGFADITDVDLYEWRAQKADFIRDHPAYDKVFWIIGRRNWLRRLCQKVVQPSTGERIFGISASPIAHFLFQLAILLAVIGSIVVEAIATPEYRHHYLQKVGLSSAWFDMAEVAFGFTLFLEFIIKVIADGFIFTPDAYLRSIWNCLDFIITIGIVTNVTMGVVFARRLGRFIQSLKALRVLRLITLIDKARNTFQAHMISGAIRILNAGIFATLLMIPYAVWSLNIFNGRINSCNDGAVSVISDCIGEYDNTVYDNAFAFPVSRVWDNSSPSTKHNFDSFPASLLALFEIMSSQGWVNVMDIATGITGRGEQQPNASTGNTIFFAIFKVFSLVIWALFVSIFMRNFKSKTGTAFLTEAQRQWIDLQRLLQRQKPFKRHEARPTAPLRRWCFDRAVDKHGWWSRTVILLFFLHTVALLLVIAVSLILFYSLVFSVQTSSKLAENPHPGSISLVIPTIYFFDVVIRSYGLGRRSFCSNGWNLFDVVVATGSFVTTLAVYFGHSVFYVRPLQQLFLVSITFKLVQLTRSLDVVLETALSILPDISTLLGLWLIFLLFFGLLFMEVFGFTKWGGSETRTTNFSSFGSTLLMLASQSTSETWNQYMHDYSLVYPKCTSSAMGDADSDCGTAMLALILFISWNILNTYIFPNMFTGLVVEHFSHVFQASGVGHKAITKEQMQSFKKIWSEFSNSKTGYLERQHFVPFFQKLGGAFEVRIYPAEHSVRNILSVCKIPSDKAAEHSRAVDGVDLSKLQLLVAQVDYADIRQRKAIYNRLYHEAKFCQEPGRGISFTNMLLLLAHHKLVVDTEALSHVTDLVNLDRIRSFLKMVACRRRFVTYLDGKQLAKFEKSASELQDLS